MMNVMFNMKDLVFNVPDEVLAELSDKIALDESHANNIACKAIESEPSEPIQRKVSFKTPAERKRTQRRKARAKRKNPVIKYKRYWVEYNFDLRRSSRAKRENERLIKEGIVCYQIEQEEKRREIAELEYCNEEKLAEKLKAEIAELFSNAESDTEIA